MDSLSLEEQLALYDSLSIVPYIRKPDGDFGFTFVGRGVGARLGREVSAILGDAGFWASQIHPDDRERATAGLAGLCANDHCRMEYRFRQEDGSFRWIGDVMRIERDSRSRPARIVGCWTDVTADRGAGQSPARDDEHFRTIFENMAETYYRVGPDGLVTMVSPAVTPLLGYTPDEAIGIDLGGLYVDPEGRGKFLVAVAAGNGSVRDYRAELRRRDGSTVWVSTNARYVRDAAGDIAGIEGTVRDVTDQIAAERALSDSEARYRQLAELSPDGMLVHVDDEIVFANASLARILAVPAASDLIGRRAGDMMVPDYRADHDRRRAGILEGMKGPEGEAAEYLRSDGSRVPVERSGGRVFWQGKPAIFILVRDVSERKRVQDELRESRDQLRLIADNLPVMIAYIDSQGCYRFANKTSFEWHRRSEEAVVGRRLADILGPQYEKIRRRVDRALAGEVASYVETLDFSDGTTRNIRVTYVPHRGPDGKVAGFFSLAEDITELSRAEEQLRQAQKMEVVGQLTGGVAHDFNNLLAVILGNLELLQEQAGDNPYAALIERAAVRGAELTQRLLAFSRQQRLQPCSIELAELVSGLGDLSRRTLGERITVATDVPETVWPVHADRGQLENALLNLAVNARDAMPDGGILEIACANVRLPEVDSRISKDVAPGDYVRICVRDNGIGIAGDVLGRVFEPFFSTKEVGEGSGLGLSMVYGFARQSGGDAVIASRPGEGTEVALFLPRGDTEEGVLAKPERRDQLKRGRGEAVLVLEDEPDVRSFVVSALQKLGYRTLEAPDAEAAMQVLKSEAGRIDLLLSDVVLPGGVSGPEFAKMARNYDAGLRIVLMSGYAAGVDAPEPLSAFDDVALAKPFRLADLSRVVYDALA